MLRVGSCEDRVGNVMKCWKSWAFGTSSAVAELGGIMCRGRASAGASFGSRGGWDGRLGLRVSGGNVGVVLSSVK